MRKIAVAAGLVLMGASGAYAAPCDTAPVINDALSGSLFFNNVIANFGSPFACTYSMTAPDPSADSFVIYSADLRGFSNEADTVRLTIDRNGGTYTSELTPGANTNFDYDGDFVAKEADGTIRGAATLTVLTDVSNGSSLATLDSIDYTEFARTSRNEVNLSLNQLNLAAVGLVTHLDGMSGLLTGGTLSLEGENEVGTYGAIGSYNAGAQGRFNLAPGFSLLGGISIFDFASTNATARGFGGALAVRYIDPNSSDMRLVAEGGVDANALSALSFTRSYTYDQLGTAMSATTTGTGTGNTFGAYGKAGLLWTVDQDNEVLLSATIKQSMLGITTYSETFNAATNPFPANLAGTNSMFTTAKANAEWTTSIASDLDLKASVGIGTTIANAGTTATVLGGGAATGTAQSTIFAEYGVGLDYQPMENISFNAFTHGTTGTGIGTHLQVGAGAKFQF